MKEQEARVDFDKHQLVLYVEKENGSFGEMQTGAYLTKNYVDDFWQKRKHLEENCLEQLRKGEISPIGYYMILVNISAADLASRLGISTAKVKKHQSFQHFQKLGLPLLKRYAEVFGIPVANLFQVIVLSKQTLSTRFTKTNNPLVVITEIVEEKV